MKKTIHDQWGDPVTVSQDEEGIPEYVYLTVSEHGREAQVELTPKKARRLAKALRKAAKEASR